jgi:hypothetical protein
MVEATDNTEAHLFVPRGIIFKTDTYIPLDAIVKRSRTEPVISQYYRILGKLEALSRQRGLQWGWPVDVRADQVYKERVNVFSLRSGSGGWGFHWGSRKDKVVSVSAGC